MRRFLLTFRLAEFDAYSDVMSVRASDWQSACQELYRLLGRVYIVACQEQ